MEQKTYESVKEFEDDIKWFKHNCRTIYPHDREIQKALKRLIGCVKGHIQIVQIVSCDECYENTYDCCTKNSITKPCSKPHLLLWAKVKGYSYWPAKVMAISIDKKKVYVQFFGDYSNSILKITRNNCYLYSKEYPDGKSHPHSESFSEALFVRIFFCSFDLIIKFYQIFDSFIIFSWHFSHRMQRYTSITFRKLITRNLTTHHLSFLIQDKSAII